MRLASVLTPLDDHHLKLAAQCGVEEITVRYPGAKLEDLLRTKALIEQHGLRLGVVEGYLPIEKIKLGCDTDGSDMAAMKLLFQHMSEAEVPLLCYNFMAGTDWVRTRVDVRERGGALVTAFDLQEAERAMSLSATASRIGQETITAEALWINLERMLTELLPVAERYGITMAMHPDDPPLMEFAGKARIMNSVENFECLMSLAPSRSSAICFCQGTFASMGVDIPAAIRRLGPYIRYVHFRDVRSSGPAKFTETFHDNGPTDMVAAMTAYRDVGFTGPMRPDHVPQLDGEENGEPGYTMMGRLFAYGHARLDAGRDALPACRCPRSARMIPHVIHPTAIIHPDARLGENVTVGAYAVIEDASEIGDGCLIQAHAILSGRVVMGRENFIGYGTVIGGYPQDLGFNPETKSEVRLGERNRIREHCTIHRATKEGGATTVGDDCYLMAGAHLGHDARVGNRVIIANNVLLGGHVQVADHVFLGGGSGFHQHIRVGRLVIAQGNSGFSKDIPPYTIGMAINMIAGLNVIGMRRAGFSSEQRREVKKAFALLYQSGLNVRQALTAAAELEWGPEAQAFFEFVSGAGKRGVCALMQSGGATGEGE